MVYKLKIKILKRYIRLVVKPFIDSQRRLIKRRQGLWSHLDLEATFSEIGQDEYVKKIKDRINQLKQGNK